LFELKADLDHSRKCRVGRPLEGRSEGGNRRRPLGPGIIVTGILYLIPHFGKPPLLLCEHIALAYLSLTPAF
jgi:hypothetical protein